MQTSGHGRGDGLMTAVPIAILVLVGLIMGGGVKGSLRIVERLLASAVDWMRTFFA